MARLRGGLRPLQIWVPDSRRPGFAQEAARQCRAAARADRQDETIDKFLDAALSDAADWWPE
jgi:hypothetical protein